jgi:hypothetical protein
VVLCEHEWWAVMVDLTVGADYFQYWLSDSVAQSDPAGGAEQQDGVIAPLGTAIQVCTGANMTEVQVQLAEGADAGTAQPQELGVAAAADLWLPSGVVVFSHFWGPVVHRHDFTTPQLCRVTVEVQGRDDTDTWGQPPERHRIWIAPTSTARDRWRSVAIDEVGRRHAVITDHVGPPEPR